MSEPIPPSPEPTAAQTYVQRRLEDQRLWHSAKATWNKRRFYAAEIATLLAGACIPIVNVWTVDDPYIARVVSAILGGVVVVAAGVAKLLKFQENWLQFRGIAETLGRERELYLGKVGDYATTDTQRETLLVDRVEALLSSTTTRFIATHRAQSTDTSGSEPTTPK
jgi:hypothetical protein